jgi:platelet-activating factor acetylhydrolase IB subunit alpha
MELEAENKTLKENESDRGRPDYSKDTLPRAPAKQTLRGHRDDITAVRFHPLYDLVASTSEDATTRIWDFESGQVEKTLKGHTGAVRDVDFHPKGDLMATCSNDLTIKLWDPKMGSCVKTLHGHDHTVSCVRFLPSGDFLVSASRDKTIKVWEIATGYCTQTMKGHDKWVRKLAVSHDGAFVASAGSDHTVHVWDMKTFKSVTLFSLHENVVEDVAFASPEACKTIFRSLQLAAASAASGGAVTDVPEAASALIPLYVASCGRDKSIRVFEASNGNLVMQFVRFPLIFAGAVPVTDNRLV